MRRPASTSGATRSLSGLLGQAEREAADAEAEAVASRARLLTLAAPELPSLWLPPPTRGRSAKPPLSMEGARRRVMLRGETRGSEGERYARDDDAMLAAMLASDASARARGATPAEPCSGVDFEEVENELTPQRVRDEARMPALMLALALTLALCVACIAAALDASLSLIAEEKLRRVLALQDGGARAWRPFVALAGVNCCFVGFAALCVNYVEPCAKGSGIPEIKAYLNGRRVPRVLHWRTVVAKVLGVLGSVGGQLPAGKEGPLIHAGAGLGATLCAALARTLHASRSVGALTTPSAVRDLVSIGCACGVAGAFAAPIGGVLFVLEEAASPQFWHTSLTSLTFLAASAAALAVSALSSLRTPHAGQMAQAALVHFGAFEGASRPEWYDRERPWRMAELPSLCALGVACGLGGAGFIALNVRLTRWRRRHVTSRRARLLEALLASLLTTTCIFWAPLIAPCRPTAGLPFALLPDSPMLAGPHCDARAHGGEEDATPAHVSVLASLLLHPLDHGVRILFHTTGALPAAELFGCALLLLWLACCAYGLSVPSGIFVPTIAIGACLGRAAGELIVLVMPRGAGVDVGGMALVGSAAFLAGVTRVTLSAAVIVVETTANVTYAPPVAIAVLLAKAVGDCFGPGLYDAHLELQRIAFLHDALPDSVRHLRAGDVASSPAVCVSEVSSARALILLLRGCSHNGFPVTYTHGPGRERKFSGMITRQQLLVLLKHRAFVPELAAGAPAAPSVCAAPRASAASSAGNGDGGSVDAAAGREAASPPFDPSPRAAGGASSLHDGFLCSSGHADGRAEIAEGQQIARAETVGIELARAMPRQASAARANGGELLHSSAPARAGTSPPGSPSTAAQAEPNDASPAASCGPGGDAPLSRAPSAPRLTQGLTAGPHAAAGLEVCASSGRWVRTASFAPNTLLPYRAFQARERRELTVANVRLREAELDRLIDLAPYMNAGAITVHPSAQLARVHLLFRSLGLRHLALTDSSSTVVGIITRRDITDATARIEPEPEAALDAELHL